MPQLEVSLVVSTQDAPHVVLVLQLVVHAPPWHTLPAEQTVPHAPQWFSSELSSTHCPEQLV
jgi:hypothetical protein